MPDASLSEFETIPTKDGFRLSQHGVVLSELRVTPGPTQSVFDVLAAAVKVLRPAGRLGLLGFAGGSMMAPLRALGAAGPVAAVDLDRAGYELFREHCLGWAGDLAWEQRDAVAWLRERDAGFDVLLDDLSIPQSGDVIKPGISWHVLPKLISEKLAPDGVAILNLLQPEQGTWAGELSRLAELYGQALVVHLDAFENRLLIGGAQLPDARAMAADLKHALQSIRSRQAGRFQVRTLRS